MLDYMWAIPLMLAPFGIIIGLVVLVVSLVNASSGSTESDGTSTENSNLAEMLGEPRKVRADAESASEPKPERRHARWTITRDQIRTKLRLTIIASVVVIAATGVNVFATLSADRSYFWLIPRGPAAAFQAIPALIVGWLMWLVWRTWKAEGTPEFSNRFARVERVQRVIGIASIVWLFFMAISSGFTGVFRNGFFAAAAFTPTLTGIIAMIVTWYGRVKIELAATEEGGKTGGR